MRKTAAGKAVKGKRLPAAATQTTETSGQSIEVEQVLEHVSSPYRWELLEVPVVAPKKPKSAQQKTGSTQ